MQQKIISNNEVNIFTNIYGEGPLIDLSMVGQKVGTVGGIRFHSLKSWGTK